MKRSNLSGSALSQYGIIIAIVALALVPLFFNIGQILFKSYEAFTHNYGVEVPVLSAKPDNVAPKTPVVVNGKTQAGSLGGTVDKPVKQCVDNKCTLDYGEFTLDGVPENYNFYLQSAGTSGSTNMLVSLLDQINSQIDKINTDADSDLLLEIANRGHKLAGYEMILEGNARDFVEDPAQLVSTQFNTNSTYLKSSVDREMFDHHVSTLNKSLSTSSNTSDLKILAIVNTLSTEIKTLANKMADIGASIPTGYNATIADVNKLLEPQASKVTNLNSAIICATGDGADTGELCK